MKTKCVILGCCIAAILATSVLAVTVVLPVTPAHVREHPKEWSVEVTKGKDGLIHFTIKRYVKVRTYHVAHLRVYHQSRLIKKSDTPSIGTNGWNTFNFALPPENITESTFDLSEHGLGDVGDVPAAGGNNYQFGLSDFVPEKLSKSALGGSAGFAGVGRDASGQPQPGFDADHPKLGAPIDPEKLQRLAWGPPATNGLRAACYFEPTNEAYSDSEVVKRRVVFHNSGQESVLFTVGFGGNDDGWMAVDERGQKVPLDHVTYMRAAAARHLVLLHCFHSSFICPRASVTRQLQRGLKVPVVEQRANRTRKFPLCGTV